MKIAMTGQGRMGAGMTARIQAAGHEVVRYDINPENRDVESLAEMVEQLEGPRVVWMMLPLKPIIDTLDELENLLAPGDVIVDGGNSHWEDSIARHARFAEKGIYYVDCGTSNGIWGREHGYGLMVGGDKEAVEILRPIFDALTPEEGGFVHAGSSGSGGFCKSAHNQAEYVIMAGLGEAYEMLQASELVDNPLEVMKAWRNGTVIQSWLLNLAVKALEQDPGLVSIEPLVQDSGEGRWLLTEAIRLGVAQPVSAATLFDRFSSRGGSDNARKLEAALRAAFGGHAVTAKVQTETTDVAGESPASDPAPQGHADDA